MMYIRYPLSLRQVEDLLFVRGIDICHETVRFWWNRFGPTFAAEIRKRRVCHRSIGCLALRVGIIAAVLWSVGYDRSEFPAQPGIYGMPLPPADEYYQHDDRPK